MFNLNVEDTTSEQQNIPPNYQEILPPSNNKKRKHDQSSVEMEELAAINRCMSVIANTKQHDEYSVFGEFVANEVRAIKHDSLRSKVKRQIQRCLLDVAEEDASMNGENSTSTIFLLTPTHDNIDASTPLPSPYNENM